MTENVTAPEVVAPEVTVEANPPKHAITICVCKNGQVIMRPGEATPRKKILVPMNIQGDSRFFVKNGEIVRPFVTFEFKLRKTLDVSGIDVSLYHEQSMDEFNPTDMVPIAIRSLDKDFDELNAKG